MVGLAFRIALALALVVVGAPLLIGSPGTAEKEGVSVDGPAGGTESMTLLLDEIIRQADPVRSILSDRPRERLSYLRAAVAGAQGVQPQITARLMLAREFLGPRVDR